MTINFPLIDKRRNPDDTWNQEHEPSESITVPSSFPHKIRLTEVPDNGFVNSRPKIIGRTETLSYPPEETNFFVDYKTGDIIFNSVDANQSFDVDYWKCGSLIEASEINYLYQRSLHIDLSPPTNPLYGKQWYNLNDHITYIYNINNKWISINTFTICFAKMNKTRDQYLYYYGGDIVSSKSGIRLSRNAIILSVSAQFNELNTGTFQIRKNNSSSNILSLDILNDLGAGNKNVDLELSEGDFLQCYFESLTNVDSPNIVVELAWRN